MHKRWVVDRSRWTKHSWPICFNHQHARSSSSSECCVATLENVKIKTKERKGKNVNKWPQSSLHRRSVLASQKITISKCSSSDRSFIWKKKGKKFSFESEEFFVGGQFCSVSHGTRKSWWCWECWYNTEAHLISSQHDVHFHLVFPVSVIT